MCRKGRGDRIPLWRYLIDYIDDLVSWKTWFDFVYNDGAGDSETLPPAVHKIFNMIEFGDHDNCTTAWETSPAVLARKAAAAALNEPFTSEEVTAALMRLKNHKASGPDKAPAECYKYAYFTDERGRMVGHMHASNICWSRWCACFWSTSALRASIQLNLS